MTTHKNSYFTTEDNTTLIYYQFPKVLAHGKAYKDMKTDAKFLYVYILDLVRLSMKNGWKDEEGKYFIRLGREKIMKMCGCTEKTATKYKKELIKFGLIEEKRLGQGDSNIVYPHKLEFTDSDVYEVEKMLEDTDEPSDSTEGEKVPFKKGKKFPSGKGENTSLKGDEFPPNKNNSINNNSINNNLKENLSINEKIKAIDLPKSIIRVLKTKTDRLNDSSLEIIELKFHAYKISINENEFADILHTVLDQDIKSSFSNYLDKSLKTYIHNRNEVAATKSTKPVRIEKIPEWYKESNDETSEVPETSDSVQEFDTDTLIELANVYGNQSAILQLEKMGVAWKDLKFSH